MVSSPETLKWNFPTEPTATPFLQSRAQPAGMAVRGLLAVLCHSHCWWKIRSCQWLVWPVLQSEPSAYLSSESQAFPDVSFPAFPPSSAVASLRGLPAMDWMTTSSCSIRSVDLCALALLSWGSGPTAPLHAALPSCLQSPSPTSIPLGLATSYYLCY